MNERWIAKAPETFINELYTAAVDTWALVALMGTIYTGNQSHISQGGSLSVSSLYMIQRD